ncbi:hypothetical protein Q31a_18150 [Aureliella helgolandensis]|uniref:Uncharacterized protein n=1 Tax=Aureliella helgolandensis TaxID=2527968 RepID=A0A518G4I9_9BACT|nr:hypothetical protein Q31a_18150 [Aureliella helgolandensis]
MVKLLWLSKDCSYPQITPPCHGSNKTTAYGVSSARFFGRVPLRVADRLANQ